MDKFFHIFGLHGRSFIPFMVSSGCAVPGVMSARVLANPKDRIVTIMVSPLMMCSAKTPVIAMLAAAFFPACAGLVFWGVWLSGWVMAFVIALIMRLTLFKGEQTPFVMELPPYRMPTLRGILQHMWERSWEYIKKAGTVILAASIVIWFLLSYPKIPAGSDSESQPSPIEYSIAGRVGHFLAPVFRPAGFDWKINVGLFAGVAAKEVIISTMGIVYGLDEKNNPGETTVQQYLEQDPAYSPLSALALMVFVMLYIPCISTLAVVRKELGSWKWPAFQAAYTLFIAWLLAVIIYQGGTLLGLGG